MTSQVDAVTIVVIGAAGVGKSTAGALVAARLGRVFVDVDDLLRAHAAAVGQPVDEFVRRVGVDGVTVAHRWWQPARLHAARRGVLEHPGAVIAFGAGHSHMEDDAPVAAITELLAPCTVVLLRADADDVVAHRILSSRRPSPDVFTDSGMLAEWIASTQNASIADVVVDVGRHTPDEVADAIVAAVTASTDGAPSDSRAGNKALG